MYHIHNSYHNAIHAADVAQMMYYMLVICDGRDIFNINKEVFMSLIIACAGHDVDHPGHNNHYEMKTKSTLAVVYNDKSVLENHHCATTFKIASNPESAIFDDMEASSQKTV